MISLRGRVVSEKVTLKLYKAVLGFMLNSETRRQVKLIAKRGCDRLSKLRCTGAVYKSEEMNKIARVCARRGEGETTS